MGLVVILLIAMVFNPYETPKEGVQVDELMFVLSFLPIVGFVVAVGSVIYGMMNPDNNYNIANEAWNVGVISIPVQIVYIIVIMVVV